MSRKSVTRILPENVLFISWLSFFAQAAFGQWRSYRHGALQTSLCGLPKMDYSSLSKKAKDVPFEIFKRLFHLFVQKCNRRTQRKLKFPKELLVTDSTKITVGVGRLPWAPLKGSRAGVKLNVAFRPSIGQPHQVVESTGNYHDICSSDALFDSAFINVADRAYAKCTRFDNYAEQKRDFVIRLKDEVVLHEPRPSRRQRSVDSFIELDAARAGKKLSALIQSQLQQWIAALPNYIKAYLPISCCES